MSPETSLAILTTLADFLLKVTFAFGIVWAIGRLVTHANRRFVIWLCFLIGAGAYWISKLSVFLRHPEAHASSGSVPVHATAIWNTFEIPDAWSSPLSLAVRALVCTYLVILGYFLVTYIRKYMHLRWVLGFTSPPPDEIKGAFAFLAEDFGLPNCKLLMLSGITSPATIGWIRPIVLLPALCVERDLAETEDILRHELHHIRRHDFLLGSVAGLLQALLFFHPVAWYARRQLELERELACDLAVVADSPNRRIEYAECLVSFARSHEAGGLQPWGVDFAAASSYLKVRLSRILHEPKEQPRWLTRVRSVAILLLFAVFFDIQPALAVFFAYARTEAPLPTRPVAQVAPPNPLKRSVSARKLLPAKIEPANLEPISVASPSVDLVEVALPEEELPTRRPLVKYDLPKSNDRELSAGAATEPQTVKPEPEDPQRNGKKSHTKMRNAAVLLVKASIVAGGIAGALENGDKD